MSNPWTQYHSNKFRVVASQSVPGPGPSYHDISAPILSTPVSSASTAPIFQHTTIASNLSLQHLYTDIKAILQSIEVSLEEQKKISKDLNDLGTTVDVLEGVLCGNRGKRKKRGKNVDLDTLQSEGGIVRRLATMDGAINDLLEHVSRLDTASRHHAVCCTASTTARPPSPPLQKEYVEASTGTDEPLPSTAPSPCLLKFQPWFPSVQHSHETPAPANWNTNPNNSYRAPASNYSQEYIHSVQHDSSTPGSPASRACVSYPAIADVSSCLAPPATLHARVTINRPDISSPLPTPSPEIPLEESFSRANDDSNSRSWTASHPRRDGPDQNMSTTSLRTFPNSLLNPILPSSNNPIYKPARTSILSASCSLDSRSNPAPSNCTPTLTLPSTSSTSGSSHHNASLPASIIASTRPSYFSRAANMHLASPPPTPTSTLAQAHTGALCYVLQEVDQDIGEDVDCEGPCAECRMRRYEPHGRHSKSTDSQVQSAEEETQDQSTVAGSSRICLNTSPGQIGTPALSFTQSSLSTPEAHPEVQGPEIDPEVSLHVSAAHPEELGREPKTTQSTPRASSKSPSHAIDLYALQRLVRGQELPLWHGSGAARMHEVGEPCDSGHMRTNEYGEVNEDFGGLSLGESLRLVHTLDTGGSGESGLDSPNEPGHDESGECEEEQSLQIEYECGGLHGTLEESFKSAEECGISLAPNDVPTSEDTQDAYPPEYRPERLADPDDSVEPELVGSEPRQPTPSDLMCLNADYQDQHENLRAEDSREQTPTDSLLRDEEAVAAALIAPSPSAESGSLPFPFSPEGLSVHLPLQPKSETSCLRVQDQGDGSPSQEPTEILDDGDDIFTPFIDFMNNYTDGATSALRSTYTEDLVEQESPKIHVVHELAATLDHQAHVESETTTSAELSAPLENTSSVHSPPTLATPPPCASSSSLSHLFRSLSPLSSLGGSSLEEVNAGDEERQDEIRVELRKTGSLNSNQDFGVPQCRTRSESSISVLQRKMLLRSLQSGELRGGPGTSIEELSILAKKDPRKIMISEFKIKRKLEPLESAIQSRQPKKKTRFHADMNSTSFSTDDVTSHLAHQLQYQGAMPQSSDPSKSAEDVMSLQVDRISAPVEVDGASVVDTTTISDPAQTFVTISQMTEPVLASSASGPWEDSISRRKRARPPSWKAGQANIQKNVQKPERNGKPKSRRPQKRKSKSLAVQEGAQMCQWPAKSENDSSFQRQFVQCDNCELWYHFGCAGFSEGDTRLEDADSVFICPPCCVSTAKRQTPRRRAEICARPDCSLTQLDTEEFVIERLVGRKIIGEAGYMFLVKWEGYPIAQASWIPEGSISGASKIFDQFVADATAEGIDPKPKEAVLLEEARHGGWNI